MTRPLLTRIEALRQELYYDVAVMLDDTVMSDDIMVQVSIRGVKADHPLVSQAQDLGWRLTKSGPYQWVNSPGGEGGEVTIFYSGE